MLSLAQWVKKAQSCVDKYDCNIGYLSVNLQFYKSIHGNVGLEYYIYTDVMGGAGIKHEDWKITLKAFEARMELAGFKKKKKMKDDTGVAE